MKFLKLRQLYLVLLPTFAILYVIIGFTLFYLQGYFLYFPVDQDFYNCTNFDTAKSFNGTRYYLVNRSAGLTIFYHGNVGSACQRHYVPSNLSVPSVIVVEYSGYSNDFLPASKNRIQEDVKNIVRLTSNYSNVTVIGEDFGSGPASYHTSIQKTSNLVLVSPLLSIKKTVKSRYPFFPSAFLERDNFKTLNLISNYTGNLLIIHSLNNTVVPLNDAIRLYESFGAKKELYVVSDRGRYDILLNESVFRKIKSFIS